MLALLLTKNKGEAVNAASPLCLQIRGDKSALLLASEMNHVVLDILQLKCSGFRSQHESVVDNKLSNRHRPAHWRRASPRPCVQLLKTNKNHGDNG